MKEKLSFFKNYIPEILLGFCVVIYSTYFSFATIIRFWNQWASYFDLGIMHQTVYNTYKSIITLDPGRFLELTDPHFSGLQIKRMAIHNDVLLAIFSTLFLIHSGPETLLTMQSLLISFGAIFVYLIASRIFKFLPRYHRYLALFFSVLFLLYPPLQRSNMFDFHAVSFSSTFLLGMYYWYLTKSWKMSFLFAILSVLTKEQVGAVVGMFGLVTLLQSKKPTSLIYVLIGFGWTLLSLTVIIPAFRNNAHFAIGYFSEFGDSPVKVMIGILLHPEGLLKIWNQENIIYLFQLLGPFSFLSLLSPLHLIILLPELMINLLSKSSNMRTINFHYTAVLHSFIVIGSIYGFRSILLTFSQKKFVKVVVVGLMVGLSIYFIWNNTPLPLGKYRDIIPVQNNRPQLAFLRSWVKKLQDDNIRVSTTHHLAPFFTGRRYFYLFSDTYENADYLIIKENEITGYFDPSEAIKMKETLRRLWSDNRYMIIDQFQDIMVYKKVNVSL